MIASSSTHEPPDVTSPTPRFSALASFPAQPQSVPLLRRLVRNLAIGWRLPAEVVDALALISTELATNAVVHSGSSDVVALLTADVDHVVLAVRDHGQWRPPVGCSGGSLPTGGRGTSLVRALAELSVLPTSSGTTVVARVPLDASPQRGRGGSDGARPVRRGRPLGARPAARTRPTLAI